MFYELEITRKYSPEQIAFLKAHKEAIEKEREFNAAETMSEIDRLADELVAADDAEFAAADTLIDWMIENTKRDVPQAWKMYAPQFESALKLRHRADVKDRLIQIALKYEIA